MGRSQGKIAGFGFQEMFKVKICCIGKTKEPWLKQAVDEYTSRLVSFLSIEWVVLKDEQQLKKALSKEAYIALDPAGKLHTSESFSIFIQNSFQKGGSRLTFVIGGAEGLSPQVRDGASALLSLSKMTFTHQITRLVFIEQLYRAFEISRGSGYHK